MNRRDERCECCMFFDVSSLGGGFCRRNPPSLVVFEQDKLRDDESGEIGYWGEWPMVIEDHWCGEFR